LKRYPQDGEIATDILRVMIEIHLDAIASSANFVGGMFLAIDALTARRRTKVRRGGEKLMEGLKAADAGRQIGHAVPETDQPLGPKVEESGKIQSPDGYVLDSIEALEDWADRLSAEKARVGFILLAIGFGLDLFSKVFGNPLFFTI
jgi:hypothetical protein